MVNYALQNMFLIVKKIITFNQPVI